ncbi:MAG TPA: prepilin-type N-terminal cleavage/methylation domain-containing protein [Pyrinomonadaceae bacterium]|nr:prepilin-type N-terminal cleavage/methylation domain-containing protein [Pyrinomonadaceae bacterium]
MSTTITTKNQGGFSIVELTIAMTLTLIIAGASATLLSQSFRMRSREDKRSDAIADAQRALNIVSREIANSGYGLMDNGIVPGDTNSNSIRIRANLNAYTLEPGSGGVTDPDEDIKYLMYIDEAENRHYLVRLDAEIAKVDRTRATTVLANRLDFFNLEFFDGNGAPIAANTAAVVNAWKVRITVGVILPEDGIRNTPGYQPPSSVRLVSDVVLRNASQITY